MAAFPLDLAQLIALFVQSVLYGVFLVSFAMCLHALWNSQLPSSGQKRMFVVVTLLLFVFATSGVAFGLRHVIDAFIYYHGSGGAAQELSDISYWVNVMEGLMYNLQTSIADFVMIYRCFVLYGRSWSIIAVLIVLWLAGIGDKVLPLTWFNSGSRYSVCEVFTTYAQFTEHRATNLDTKRVIPWLASILAVTMALNVIATGLIVYRIWSVEHRSKDFIICSRDSSGRKESALKRAMRIIIESGVLYTVSVFLFFVTFLAKNNAQYATSHAVVQIIGIAFNMIIIRVNQRQSVDTSSAQSGRYNTEPFFALGYSGSRVAQDMPLAGISVDITVESDQCTTKNYGEERVELNSLAPSTSSRK
ncbi:hypothetical protein EIP91_009075 [Steccherinum ochraceum]|uniref:G-protein coupled receptors family 1 profile domain-containing protein n=1 Tax=Steccherinum ochraceum TaxID=92696 RepID=A0A4R0R240_9APHY|nr:hypothetical protein EIP91_009075 [Steccherinum ochraceum]